MTTETQVLSTRRELVVLNTREPGMHAEAFNRRRDLVRRQVFLMLLEEMEAGDGRMALAQAKLAVFDFAAEAWEHLLAHLDAEEGRA